MVGKATIKAKLHALIQISIRLLTKPKLKILMTNDIIPDIRNAIINENTIFWCLRGIMARTHILK
jgi:hypothetical protein